MSRRFNDFRTSYSGNQNHGADSDFDSAEYQHIEEETNQYKPLFTEPADIAALFERIRREEDLDHRHIEMAQASYQIINKRLNERYGHERHVDWYDHPEATLLVLGLAATGRIIAYDGNPQPQNDRLKDWNFAMTAVGLCLEVASGNAVLRAVEEHGQYEKRAIFTGEED